MQQGMFTGPGEGEINALMDREFQQGLAGPQDGYPTFASNFGMAQRGFQAAMGKEDPRLEKAKKMELAKKEISETIQNTGDTIAYYTKVAEVFRKHGLLDEAFNMERTVEALKDKDDDREIKKETLLAAKETRLAALAAKAQTLPMHKEFTDLLKAISAADPVSEANAIKAFIAAGGGKEGINAGLSLIEKASKDGTDRRPTSVEANGRQYILDPETWKTAPKEQRHPFIKDYVDAGKSSDRAPKIVNSLQMPKDLSGLRGNFLKEVQEYDERIRALKDFDSVLAKATENPDSAAAARNMFARAFRTDSQQARAEIDRLVGAGALPDRIARVFSDFFVGTMTVQKQQNMKKAVDELRRRDKSDRAKVQQQYKGLGLADTEYNFVTGGAQVQEEDEKDPLGLLKK